jgi:hypothetical protein
MSIKKSSIQELGTRLLHADDEQAHSTPPVAPNISQVGVVPESKGFAESVKANFDRFMQGVDYLSAASS